MNNCRISFRWWRPQNCPSHHQSAKTQSLDFETVSGMYVVILSGAVISVLLCVLQYIYGQLRRKRVSAYLKNLKSKCLSQELNRSPAFPNMGPYTSSRYMCQGRLPIQKKMSYAVEPFLDGFTIQSPKASPSYLKPSS